MRIGVLGGSFNPPHIGHLLIAVDAFEALALDKLMIVPAGTQPLKGDVGGPTPAQRLEMVRRAFGDDRRFDVCAMEIERGGLSYTVDTLESLAADNKGAELVLLVGSDAIAGFDKWKSPGRITELSRIAILSRGQQNEDDPRGPAGNGAFGQAEVVTTRRLDVSSSEIRARAEAGKSIRGFVAESVEEYISTAKLYRA
ncbi:MAG TPA: nicotinate (nicotinamide) nucleotide adenylyltransferase [Gemmatimonadaceae bacterium]|nr:nicotinate (nicotinamide) nucleotide adenylyltransferase [Gemmatimonadaceae bacterium]